MALIVFNSHGAAIPYCTELSGLIDNARDGGGSPTAYERLVDALDGAEDATPGVPLHVHIEDADAAAARIALQNALDASAGTQRTPALALEATFVFPGDVEVVETDEEKLAAAGVSNPFEVAHALDNLDMGYGDETIVHTASGRELRCPAPPRRCEYVRVAVQIDGRTYETACWRRNEWCRAPSEVMSAIVGALASRPVGRPSHGSTQVGSTKGAPMPETAEMHEMMNTGDYYANDDNFDGNDVQLDGLKCLALAYRDAAQAVVNSWEKGDLAAAVRDLQAVLADTTPLPPGFWEGKAERLGFTLTQCATGDYWMIEGDDEPTRYDTAKEAVESLE